MYGLQHVQVALFHRWRKDIGLANFFFRAGYILCIDIIAAEVGGLLQGKYVRIKIANAVGIPIESYMKEQAFVFRRQAQIDIGKNAV